MSPDQLRLGPNLGCVGVDSAEKWRIFAACFEIYKIDPRRFTKQKQFNEKASIERAPKRMSKYDENK